ncbi:MAG: sensor histidine kinase [Anaerolineales bacterium]
MIWDTSSFVALLVLALLLLAALNAWGWRMMRKTARRAAREAAAEERYRFLRRLDHELKNPLTALQIGLANLAGTDEDPSPERQHIRESLRGQIERLNRLVSSLRKLADLEFAPLERAPLDPAEMLREAFAVLEDYPETSARDLRLVLPADDLPSPSGDRDLLQLAIYNVLDNAMKFTRARDVITLVAEANDDGLTITVQDTGPGIAPDDLPHVWEDLYRSPSAHGIPGNGLGLALVKIIMEKHGGAASISSTPGDGTTVRLSLPIS